MKLPTFRLPVAGATMSMMMRTMSIADMMDITDRVRNGAATKIYKR